jgi:hypothetical protein
MSNPNLFTLVIKGDTNDGDYISEEYDFDLNDKTPFIKANEYIPNTEDITFVDLICKLAEVLKLPRKTRHNWSRDEYDDNDSKYETIEMLIHQLYGYTLEDLETNFNIDTDDLLEEFSEIVSDNLPYGEFGIHSIVEISYLPKMEKTFLFG